VTGLEWNRYALPADAFIAPTARLLGDVRLGAGASIWYGALVDGRPASVELAPGANVQDNAVVEATPGHPVSIGAGTSVGHNAHVVGATIEPSSLVAIGSTVQQGARIGADSIVAANAVVPAGERVPPGSLVIGAGRIRRQVSAAEVERIRRGEREYRRLAAEHRATLEQRER
jgi:carbonic anhydrase/acetyltransferase-like protein (isoleucine patch superfamily)